MIYWGYQRVANLPQGTTQNIIIDSRGQNVSVNKLIQIRNAIKDAVKGGNGDANSSSVLGGVGAQATSGGGVPAPGANIRVYNFID